MERNLNNVEPDCMGIRASCIPELHALGQIKKLPLLGGSDGGRGSHGASGSARLHFHKDQNRSVLSENVDLSSSKIEVPMQDSIALASKVAGGDSLASPSGAPTRSSPFSNSFSQREPAGREAECEELQKSWRFPPGLWFLI